MLRPRPLFVSYGQFLISGQTFTKQFPSILVNSTILFHDDAPGINLSIAHTCTQIQHKMSVTSIDPGHKFNPWPPQIGHRE